MEPSGQIDGRGPTSYHVSMTLVFSTENGIPSNGTILIVMDSDWDPTEDSCVAEGLDNLDENTPVRCTRNGHIFTLD